MLNCYAPDSPELFSGGIDQKQFELRLQQYVNTLSNGASPDRIEAVCQAIRTNYVNSRVADDPEANRQALVRVYIYIYIYIYMCI